jgi:hypothetical protein
LYWESLVSQDLAAQVRPDAYVLGAREAPVNLRPFIDVSLMVASISDTT